MESKPKPMLHQSHLALLYKCGIKFARIVLDGEREPATTPLVVGQATHTTIAKNLTNKIIRGSLLPREAMQDYARDDFLAEWKQLPIVLNEEERFWGIGKTREKAQDMTIRLVTVHHYDIAPSLKPKAVERKWVLEAPDFPYDMAGQIDIDEDIGIRDTKTRKTNLGQREIDQSEQYTFYSLAKFLIDGILPQYVAQDNLVKPTKKRAEYAVSYYSTRTQDDFAVVMRRWEQANRIIKMGIYTPANPTDWWCSADFCGFAANGSCPFYNSKSRKAYKRETENQGQPKEACHGRGKGDGEAVIESLSRIVARSAADVPGAGSSAASRAFCY